MKSIDDPFRNSAIANALSSIKKETRFPRDVFTKKWDDFLFFDSYTMFQGSFIEAKNVILREEGSSGIALINLGNVPSASDAKEDVMFLEKSTEAAEYIAHLKGDGSPLNWMFLMDRYVCASDKGNWCIYCEKENDMAVLALRDTFSKQTLSKLSNLLMADSIKTIFDSKVSWLFDFNKLVPEWKSALINDYKH